MTFRLLAIALIGLSSSAAFASYTCTTHSGDDRVFTGHDADQNVAQRKAAEACDAGGRTSKRQCYGNVSCSFDGGGWNPGPRPGPRPFPPHPRPQFWYCSTHNNDGREWSAQHYDRNTAQLEAAKACDNGGRTSKRRCYGNVSCQPVRGW